MKDPKTADFNKQMTELIQGGLFTTFAGQSVIVHNYNLTHEQSGVSRKAHVHPHTELAFLVSGQCEYQVQNEAWIRGPGEGVLIPRGMLHSRRVLKETVIFSYWLNAGSARELKNASKEKQAERFEISEYELFHINRIYQEVEKQRVDFRPAIRCHLQLLLINILRILKPMQQENGEYTNASIRSKIERVLQFISENVGRTPPVTEVARAAGLSAKQLNTYMKRWCGTTLHDYILQAKVVHCYSRLINHPETSITEVAHKAGFFDLSYFSKLIRAQYGKSPSQIRKRQWTGS